MESKKVCPLKFTIGVFRDDPLCYQCEEEKCAWWCQWTESCAMVAIPAELDDQAANGELIWINLNVVGVQE